MIDQFQVVCNTAAGRRRYMQYLIPQVIASDVVDRYDIWVNTVDKQDIEFFRILAAKFPKINLIYQPEGVVNGIASINSFYRKCVEKDTIYFKLDDDIVWIETGAIEKMVRFRVDNPHYFLVSPLVINNALCTYILQSQSKIKLNGYYRAVAADEVLWRNSDFACQLHEWFLEKLKKGSYADLHCGTYPISMNRFSINAILWFGSEMARFDGVVPGDDEEWLSCIRPTEIGASNCFNADALCSHFAFYPQRAALDEHNILEQYAEYLNREWEKDPKMKEIHRIVQEAMKTVEQNKEAILAQPEIYQTVPQPKPSLFDKLGKIRLPYLTFRSIVQMKRQFRKKREKREMKRFTWISGA
ncbi:MAG: hypothetical protein RR202_10310 [Bacteroidales bacterium]